MHTPRREGGRGREGGREGGRVVVWVSGIVRAGEGAGGNKERERERKRRGKVLDPKAKRDNTV